MPGSFSIIRLLFVDIIKSISFGTVFLSYPTTMCLSVTVLEVWPLYFSFVVKVVWPFFYQSQ